MKKSDLKISFDAAKLAAVKQYLEKKELDIAAELEDAIVKLYEKYVPAAVREYIEFNAESSDENPPKPKKTVVTGTGNPDGTTRQSV